MKLILIRHGKTEANEKHLYCGATDIGLSENGKRALYELMKELTYPDIAGMHILTSGMLRCEETLSILYGNRPHEVRSEFREMDFGVFEMRSYEQMKNDSAYIEWISNDNEANIAPGGESGNIMKNRVIKALNDLIAKGEDTAIFTHGGVIAAIMEHLFPNESKNRYQWQPSPGGGYIISFDENCRVYREIV